MKIARLAGLTFTIVLALCLASASAALAEAEFTPTGGTLTGTSTTTNELIAGGNSIICTGNKTNTGTISSPTLVGGVVVSFTGCKSTGSGGSNCTVKSTNTSTEGALVTNTLHGVLGLILPKGTGSGVGLLLLPVANKKFLTLGSNKCTIESAVTGNLAAEWLVLKRVFKIFLIHFKVSIGIGQSIKTFDPSTGGSVTPELEAFGLEAAQNATESLEVTPEMEVT